MTGTLYEIVAEQSRREPSQFFSVLYGLLKSRSGLLFGNLPVIALEMHAAHGRVSFFLWLPNEELLPFITPIFQSAYANVELRAVAHDPMPTREHGHVAVASLGLTRPSRYPIRTELDGTDLLDPLISMIGKPHGRNQIHVSLLIRAKPNVWQASARKKAIELRYGKRQGLIHEIVFGASPKPHGLIDEIVFGEKHHQRLTKSPHRLELAKAIEEKARHPAFECELRIVAAAPDALHAWGYVRAALATLDTYRGDNSFRRKRPLSRTRFERRVRERSFTFGHSFLLSVPEIAALYHLPSVSSPYVETLRAPKLPPPATLPNAGRIIGRTNYPELEREFGISVEDARRHTYILGPTGSGKSTLLLNLILQDIEAGRGVAVLDPKSDLVAAILARMPEHRINDVVLIEPDDVYSVGLNPLEETREEDVDLVTEEIIAIIRRIYSDYGWGSRMSEVLKVSLLTLLRHRDMTLGHIVLLLTDKNFRRKMTATINDPIGLTPFWRNFEQLTDGQRAEMMGSAMNRLRDVLLRGRVRRILCQKHSTFSFERIVNGNGILLADLNEAKYGPDSAALIGSLVFARLWQTGKKRSHTPEEQRRDFCLYVDEFQQFLGSARDFENVLAQARGFRIGLILANQHFGQLPALLRDAISANARSKIVFQCGQEDARYLAREFQPLSDQALQHLGPYEIAVKLSIRGEQSQPFTAVTLPPADVTDPTVSQRVRDTARTLHARPVSEVDEEVLAEFAAAEVEPEGGVGRR
jgi:hypothetical protein